MSNQTDCRMMLVCRWRTGQMMGRAFHARQVKEKRFFFEKRTKKLLQIWTEPNRKTAAKSSKVFCFFFSKKKALPPPAFASGQPRQNRTTALSALHIWTGHPDLGASASHPGE
jgi:hypothetical protein